jgi:hypothetical protein
VRSRPSGWAVLAGDSMVEYVCARVSDVHLGQGTGVCLHCVGQSGRLLVQSYNSSAGCLCTFLEVAIG